MPLPYLHWMPRVRSDIRRCLDFIARQPWGKRCDREREIYEGIWEIRMAPEHHKVIVRRPSDGVELRRYNAGQFAIIYAYLRPNAKFPLGVVSIRAVRHVRVRNVFSGVKEPVAAYATAAYTSDAEVATAQSTSGRAAR